MSQVCLDVFNGSGAFAFVPREWSHIVLLVHQCALLKNEISLLSRVKVSRSQSVVSFLLAGVRVLMVWVQIPSL